MIRILLTRIASVGLIACALFAWSEAQAQQDTLYMNLEECIKYGLRNNVNVKNADIDTHSADASVGEVRAQGLPQINSQITMTNNLAIQVTPIPDFLSPVVYQVLQAENLATIPEGVGEGVFPAAFGTNYAANASVTLEQMIFNGSYFIGLKAARTYREMAALQKKGVEIDMVEAITSAYYSFLVGEEGLKLAADNFKRIDTLRRETRIMYENGVAERIDMNRVEVEYNNSKTELQNLYRSYAVNMLGLKYQMGMPVNTPLKITENISSIEVDLLKMSEEEYS
ncbi:MAG: TolC family protein, partial [Cyclobacteriaceae bacterium]